MTFKVILKEGRVIGTMSWYLEHGRLVRGLMLLSNDDDDFPSVRSAVEPYTVKKGDQVEEARDGEVLFYDRKVRAFVRLANDWSVRCVDDPVFREEFIRELLRRMTHDPPDPEMRK